MGGETSTSVSSNALFKTLSVKAGAGDSSKEHSELQGESMMRKKGHYFEVGARKAVQVLEGAGYKDELSTHCVKAAAA